MGNKVAVDVKATASSQKYPADLNQSGSWQVVGMPIKELTFNLKTENGAAIHSATATFSYIGGSTPGSPPGPPRVPLPSIPSSVQLKAQNTALTDSGKSVLVAGDTAQDNFGNKLEVSGTSSKVETG